MQSKLSNPTWLMQAPWVQPSQGLMHADSWRLTWKIWYHLHLIFIYHLWWDQKCLTARGYHWEEERRVRRVSLRLFEKKEGVGFMRRPHLGSAHASPWPHWKMKSKVFYFISPFVLEHIGLLVKHSAKFSFFWGMADMPGLGSALMRPLRMIAFRKSALVYWTQGFIWSSQSEQSV